MLKKLLEIKIGGVLQFMLLAVAVFGLSPLIAYSLKGAGILVCWCYSLVMPATILANPWYWQIVQGLFVCFIAALAAAVVDNKYKL